MGFHIAGKLTARHPQPSIGSGARIGPDAPPTPRVVPCVFAAPRTSSPHPKVTLTRHLPEEDKKPAR
ncbi:hypothetical protein [Pseudoxanthobacter soli]|uniref:hypothetical protein n=1 Tax=Pseudoxanthobacter soli TaxID=433840 RepID=UPI00093697A4|nr:hypothetical protein [Pseudoxanthobacter soli]